VQRSVAVNLPLAARDAFGRPSVGTQLAVGRVELRVFAERMLLL